MCGKQRPVRPVADGAGAVVPEAHVHADIGIHALDGAGDDVEERLGVAGMAGEAGLVELDEIDAGGGERRELGVDDRDQGVGHGVAIGVDRAAVDAAGQRERAGHGHLDRRVGILAEPAILGHGAQAVGRGERRDAAIAVALIVGRRTPAADARDRLEPCEIFVEPQVEIDALHFAVGDPVEAGAELVVDRQADGVADGLVAIGRAESARAAAFTSATNFSNQPGNDQLPITVAGISCSTIRRRPFPGLRGSSSGRGDEPTSNELHTDRHRRFLHRPGRVTQLYSRAIRGRWEERGGPREKPSLERRHRSPAWGVRRKCRRGPGPFHTRNLPGCQNRSKKGRGSSLPGHGMTLPPTTVFSLGALRRWRASVSRW